MKNVLWTGGGTLLPVLQLVFERREAVQPYYVTDPARLSTQMELTTMERLRRMIAEKEPWAASLLMPSSS